MSDLKALIHQARAFIPGGRGWLEYIDIPNDVKSVEYIVEIIDERGEFMDEAEASNCDWIVPGTLMIGEMKD